jgi:hypothetical protein
LPAFILVFTTCHVGCMHQKKCFYASGSIVLKNFDEVEVWRCLWHHLGKTTESRQYIIYTRLSGSCHVPINVLSIVRTQVQSHTRSDLPCSSVSTRLPLSDFSLFRANPPDVVHFGCGHLADWRSLTLSKQRTLVKLWGHSTS